MRGYRKAMRDLEREHEEIFGKKNNPSGYKKDFWREYTTKEKEWERKKKKSDKEKEKEKEDEDEEKESNWSVITQFDIQRQKQIGNQKRPRYEDKLYLGNGVINAPREVIRQRLR